MSADKLLSLLEENSFRYNDLTIRRINVQFSDGDSRTSFRASIKAVKDEQIVASITKLNIPMGRVSLTPESVTFINYMDKNYYTGDYSFIDNLLGFSLDFEMIQALLIHPSGTNLLSSGKGNQRFKTNIEEGRYALVPVENSHTSNVEQKSALFRKNRKQTASVSENFAINKIIINPQHYVLEKLTMADPDDGRMFEINLSEYTSLGDYNYPGAIDFKVSSGNETTEINIKLRGMSTEKLEPVEITIPGSYQRIRPR